MVVTRITALYKSKAYDRLTEIAPCPNGHNWVSENTYDGIRHMKRSKGFGLLELMIALVIALLLLSIAVPTYDSHVQRAKNAKARADIATLSVEIERFRLRNLDRIPATLDQLGIEIPFDPWGESYRYVNIPDAGAGVGNFRKDGKLNPLNTDFDLYSMGRDRKSSNPLSAAASRDDIVRANNGAFIGLGEDY
jgi:general secretion pathway protein G